MKRLWRFGMILCMVLAMAQGLVVQTTRVATSSAADFLSVDKIFTNDMVLQRDQPIHIWGRGLPGASVRVTLALQASAVVSRPSSANQAISAVARVKPDSSWSVYLHAQSASSQPRDLKIISGKKNILISNMLLGDIWICIGQSNMEWPMKSEMHYREAKATANQPLLLFYNPSYAGKNIFNQYFSDSVLQMMSPEKFYAPTSWQVSDSNTFSNMSAVAFYFGKQIVSATQVPIGLIHLSMGGAPLETFIGVEALKSSAQFAEKTIEPWLTNPAIPTWVKERGRQNLRAGTNHPFKPGYAYAAGIATLFKMGIKGIINYQGESNAQELERVNEYAALTKLMVDDYRKGFKQPNLPFYFVQLSSIDTLKYKGHYWPQFRNEQRKIVDQIAYSGMAVSSDIGARDNVHPTNKKLVGERLARWALNKNYGVAVLPSGPLPLSAQYSNGQIIIDLNYVAGGLKTTDGKDLRGFSLDGINEVAATIQQNNIHISAKTKPDFVYYGWKPYSDGNLVNSEQLPASTFKIKVQ